jgi:hypothetical protein
MQDERLGLAVMPQQNPLAQKSALPQVLVANKNLQLERSICFGKEKDDSRDR